MIKNKMNLWEDEVGLDINNFSLNNGIIYYKNYPLWRTVSSKVEDHMFAYYDPNLNGNIEDDPRFYILVCIDCYGDRYHYGHWDKKEELDKWLNNPCDKNHSHKILSMLLFNK